MPANRVDLNHGRHFLSIPGPSVIPDRVLAAMSRPMPNIYEGDLVDMSNGILEEIKGVARTSGHGFIAIANGHGAWEMALTNTLSKGDTVLVLESGRFAAGWGAQAKMLGVHVQSIVADPRDAVDPQAVEAALRDDDDHAIKAVLVVQVDTATSVWNDIAAIRAAMDAADHPALLMVDTIASMGCMQYEMDQWGVDVTVGGAQKGLMVPPGLGFVWASDKALEVHKSAELRTAYWDWSARMGDGGHYLRYCGTPPVSHLFALREALDMIAEEGLENIWARHGCIARAVRSAVDAWSTTDGIEFNVADPAHRSDSVTTVLSNDIDAPRLRALCETEAGVTLGIGLPPFEGKAFRIGHMGHLSPPMILGTLGTIEAALSAMDVPVTKSGVAAAASELGAAMAA